jgi:putative SOS response-associated peptidase YedK
MAFAGLWETWTGPNGEEMETAAIVTTTANRTLIPIHGRMPVIIPPEAFDFWLDPNVDSVTAAALIAPAREDLLEVYPVSNAVNRVANDAPQLIEPATGEPEPPPEPPKLAQKKPKKKKDDGQGSLF